MSKQTISVSLEEDLIKVIDTYKKDKLLSSRSAALERILLERKTKDDIKQIVLEILQENNLNISSETKNIKNIQKNDNDMTFKSIKNTFSNMPDD